jgi:uncharacterized cupredoxin-like copper-binding protein
MKARILLLAALGMTPIAVYAHGDAHQGMMRGIDGMAEAGHAEDGGHALGVGKPGDPKKVSRAIQVLMSDDMKFTPANIDVKRGETIRFVVRNTGRVKHEMVIGSMTELKQHAELMRRFPGMEHADPNMVTLAPGESGQLIWQFTQAGRFDFACLQPGHFEAGMMGEVSVK